MFRVTEIREIDEANEFRSRDPQRQHALDNARALEATLQPTPVMDWVELNRPVLYDTIIHEIALELYQLDWRTNRAAERVMRIEAERRIRWGLKHANSIWANRMADIAGRQPEMSLDLSESIAVKNNSNRHASMAVADIIGVSYKEYEDFVKGK